MSKRLSNTKFIIAITIVMLIFSAFMIIPDTEEAAVDPGEGWSKCGDNLWYNLNGTVLTFKGSGAMWDYGDGDYNPKSTWGGPWGKNVTEVIWTSGNCNITKIGHSAFIYCNNLTSMHWNNAENVGGEGRVPGSVTAVSKFGFYHCGFTTMTFESGNKVSLDRYSLSGMPNVVKLTFNKASSFQTIYPVVDWCGNLTTLEFKGNVKYGWMTFNGSNKIDTLIIGKNVSNIEGLRTDQNGDLPINNYIVDPGNNTYSLDDGVLLKKSGSDLYVEVVPINKEYYYMSDDVTKIAHAAFAHSSIKELHISNKLTTIEYGAFRWSESLKTVLLPDSCTYVGNGAFIGCTALKTIHFGTGLKTMWAETFEYADIEKFSNNGKNVKIDYNGAWVDHQLTDQEIGYLKNMTFSRDDEVMKNTSNRYAVVAFNLNQGGDSFTSLQVKKQGDGLTAPAEPTWALHAFDGWFKDRDKYDREWLFDSDKVREDQLLFANWTADSHVTTGKYSAWSWNGVQRALTLDAVNTIELQRDIYSYGKNHLNAARNVTIDLHGCTLDRQRTTTDPDGHVIWVRSPSTVTIKDTIGTGKITGGYANNGGGINVESGATCIIAGGTITGNKASNSGGGICVRGTLTITGGKVEGNVSYNVGGGIFSEGTLTIGGQTDVSNVRIAGNTATKSGGALYIYDGTTTIGGHSADVIDISSNSVLNGDGGGIFLAINTSCVLNLNGGSITGNIASGEGGGILYKAGTLNVKGKPVVEQNIAATGNNVMLDNNAIIYVKETLLNGAKIGLMAKDPTHYLAEPDGSAVIELARFSYEGGTLVIENSKLKVNLTNIPGDYHQVTTWAALQTAINANTAKIALSADITAGSKDDRIKVNNGKTVIIDLFGHTLNRNRSSSDSDGHVIQVMSGGNLTLADTRGGGKITGGYANNGGGINVSEGGICTITGGTITGNKASIDGGGICVKGTLIATGGTIVGNSASDTGGAIFVGGNGTIRLTNITIANNTSKNYGGGLNIHVKDNNSWIRDSFIIGNTAKDDNGGAIYFNESSRTLTVERTIISGNSCSDNGGAIYNNDGTLVLTNCEIYNNTADEDGGAIYNNDATVTINGGVISSNTCKKSGGAIRAYDGNTNINDVTFTGNVAKENGGAIYQNNGGTVSINGCVMEGNTASKKGGAVIVNESSDNTFKLKGTVVIHGNKGTDGNDLYLASDKKITITGALGDGTRIGVTLENSTGKFTSGYSTYNQDKDPAIFFETDYGFAPYLNGNEAAVGKMSSTSLISVSISRTDSRTTSLTVRVKLLKNGVEIKSEVMDISQKDYCSFETSSVGVAVYSIAAEVTAGASMERYACTVTGSNTSFAVTCKDAVQDTIGLINSIGTVVDTGACKTRIDAAKAAYEDLNETQKGLVSNYGTLMLAEKTYPAKQVETKISAIGTVEYTDACKTKIDAARAAYEDLNETQKGLVSNYGTLTAAEAKYAELETDHTKANEVIALINAIGPYVSPTTQDYRERTADARNAYDALTAAQKALVSNYNALVAAESNIYPPTDLPAGVVTFAGWTYGGYTSHDPTVNTSVVTDSTLKAYLDSVVNGVTFSYEDSSGNGILPSNTLPAGVYTVKAVFPRDNAHTYWATTQFTVEKVVLTAQALSISWVGGAEYDGTNKAVNATAGPLSAGSGLDITVTPGAGIINPGDAGSYTIVLTITDGSYRFEIPGATDIMYSTTLNILKAKNSITSLSLSGWTYGDDANTPVATAEHGNPSFSYSDSEAGTYTKTVPTGVGSYYVKATVDGNNYESATATLQFSISKAKLTVSAEDKTVVKGQLAPTYTYVVTGFKSGDTWENCFAHVPVLTCSYDQGSPAGLYYIQMDISGVSPTDKGMNYTLETNDATLDVTSATAYTVTFVAGEGGSVTPASTTVMENHPYSYGSGLTGNALPTPTKTGYTFDGWFTAASEGTEIDPADIVESSHSIYAHWTVNKYTVVFDANRPANASGMIGGYMDDQGFTYDVAQNLSKNKYTLAGWTFEGWNAKADGSGSSYSDEASVNNLTDKPGVVKLYARWAAIDCTVTFQSNGGTEVAGGSVKYDSTYKSHSGWLPTPTLTNYDFGGWYTENSGGTKVSNDTKVTSSHTLYARWTTTVTLDGYTQAITATKGFSTFDAVAIPSKTGYVFAGYYTAAEGGSLIIAAPESGSTISGFVHSAVEGYIDNDGKWIAVDNKTLYPHWTTTVTLVFGDEEEESGKSVLTVTYKSNTFGTITSPGTGFIGYHTPAGDKLIDKSDLTRFIDPDTEIAGYLDVDGKWIADGPKTLYAYWENNKCTVSFDTGAMPHNPITSEVVDYGHSYASTPLPVSDVAGYTVAWYTAKGVQVTAGMIVTSSHTLYAVWTMSVTLDANGGSGGSGSLTATYGGNTFPDVTVPTKAGNAFIGYFTEASGGSLVISPPDLGTTVNVFSHGAVAGYIDANGNWIKPATTDPVTLYAQWAEAYTVTFNYHGGAGSTDSKTVVKGQQIGTLPTATKAGYTLNGWYTEESGGTKIETATVVVADIEIHAQWTANTYYVEFDKNNGWASGTMSKETFTYDVVRALPQNAFASPGHMFLGWNTEAGGGGISYTDEQNVVNLTALSGGTMKMYGQWQANEYTVTFNPSGGSVDLESITVTFGHFYGELPTPTKENVIFDGWYTSSTGGTKITAGTVVSTTSDHTLYAHWISPPTPGPTPKPTTVTVSFDSQGGTPAKSMKVTVESVYGSLPTTTKEGYVFEGWYTSAGGGSKVTPATLVTSKSDHTLYAHWAKSEHIVNPDGSVTDRYTEEYVGEDGSRKVRIDEITTWKDGSSLAKETVDYEKNNPDGTFVKEHFEKTINADTSGNVTAINEVTKIETSSEVTTRTKTTDISSDGKATTKDAIVSVIKAHDIVTAAWSETTPEGASALATTAIQAPKGAIGADIAAAAVTNLKYVEEMLGVPDVDKSIQIDSSGAKSVIVVSDALEVFAVTDIGLSFAFGDGTLIYDADATETLSEFGDVEVTMSMDDVSVLTEKQRAVIGDASFVSVIATAGQTYIADLGGTLTITFPFSSPQGSKNYGAYYVADDGTKTAAGWSYDEELGIAAITTPHQSVYAILKEGGESDMSIVWIAGGIAAILIVVAVAFFVVRSGKAKN